MQWIVEVLMALLFALSGAEAPKQVEVTVYFGSGVTQQYQLRVEEGKLAQFGTTSDGFEFELGDFEIPLYSGDTVCLPLQWVPLFAHRDAAPDTQSRENGCFGIDLLNQGGGIAN